MGARIEPDQRMCGAMNDKTVFITGASSGIGYGTAARFAQAGWNVALSARREENLRVLQDEIAKQGGCADVFCADVTSAQQLHDALDGANRRFGGVNAVVHCAGMNVKHTAQELSETDWDRILDTNLKSAYFLSRAALPYLERAAGAHAAKFLVIGSVGTFLGIPLSSAYCASKGGLVQFVRALSVEWAGRGICVNAVCPGYVRTKMSEATFKIGNTYEKIIGRIPMHRLGGVDDIANALLFLASDQSDYITGTTLNVDGGLMAAAYAMED